MNVCLQSIYSSVPEEINLLQLGEVILEETLEIMVDEIVEENIDIAIEIQL